MDYRLPSRRNGESQERGKKMNEINTLTYGEKLDRLALFIKPEFMPVTACQVDYYYQEAQENGGRVEVSRHHSISGHTELFSL